MKKYGRKATLIMNLVFDLHDSTTPCRSLKSYSIAAAATVTSPEHPLQYGGESELCKMLYNTLVQITLC
jgi:hypothetical protein